MVILIVKERSSLVMMWLIIEIMLFLFLPVLFSAEGVRRAISRIKYFISQTPVSLLILISLLWPESINRVYNILVLSLLFKLGLPPFHGWVISMIREIEFLSLTVLFTFQKFIPVLILNSIYISNYILLISFILSMVLFARRIFSLNNVKLILLFSSIYSSYWMLVLNSNIWEFFFINYLIRLVLFNYLISVISLNVIRDCNFKSGKYKWVLTLLFLNLGGFPPFLMFFSKVVLLLLLVKINRIWFIVLFFTSPLVFQFYLQLIISININLNKVSFI